MKNEEKPEKKPSERLMHKLRTAQAMSRRAERSKGQLGWPKRRKPSMPPTPWDKEPTDA